MAKTSAIMGKGAEQIFTKTTAFIEQPRPRQNSDFVNIDRSQEI